MSRAESHSNRAEAPINMEGSEEISKFISKSRRAELEVSEKYEKIILQSAMVDGSLSELGVIHRIGNLSQLKVERGWVDREDVIWPSSASESLGKDKSREL